MKKYINADDLEQLLQDCKFRITIETRKHINSFAKPMVSVSEIEKVIKKHREGFNGHLTPPHIQKLLDIIKPKPTKYGGLTIKELRQLTKLNYVRCETSVSARVQFEEFISQVADLTTITQILPDPQGSFYRYHDGSEQPIPDNVIVDKVRKNNSYYIGKAKDIMWAEAFGFRIVGVAEDDKN